MARKMEIMREMKRGDGDREIKKVQKNERWLSCANSLIY
jgi:hypothetical protein